MKQNKGITLITLVITIVILIILAGVVINLALGENGLINRAKQAKEDYSNAHDKEQQELNDLYSQILIATNDSSQVTISIEDLNKLIDERIKKASVTTVPTGTIISYMGNNAPMGYLFCDGTVYNISDYQNLAEQIKTEFGSYNYYGGDGETTFAVPDLRGEFLRGTGTATRDTGTGASVGTHQDATIHMNLTTMSTGFSVYRTNMSTGGTQVSNQDKNIGTSSTYAQINRDITGTNSSSFPFQYTSRPTNTSVLYCIKY